MAKYRKKPVVIEAFCFGIDPIPDWFCDARSANRIRTYGEYKNLTHCEIETLEGVMRGQRGDYIIQGVVGEIYACKADIFEKTYDLKNKDTVTGTDHIAFQDYMKEKQEK